MRAVAAENMEGILEAAAAAIVQMRLESSRDGDRFSIGDRLTIVPTMKSGRRAWRVEDSETGEVGSYWDGRSAVRRAVLRWVELELEGIWK